jgi:hypothetical protein
MIRLIEKSMGRISDDDYALICSFWKGRGSPPPRNLLPTLGVLVDEMACGFLYLDATGSGVAVMAWTATDPAAPHIERGHAMLEVIGFLEKEATALGYHTVMTTHCHPSFIRLFTRRGYASGDSGLVQLFKSLDGVDPLLS